jgi:GT2 family glycosyltransferase
MLRRYYVDDISANIVQEVDWLNGACTLFRRPVFDRVGVYDEANFFMYSEELDLCRRIKAAGWRIAYVPDAKVIHYEGKSSEQAVAARHIRFNTSKVRYFRKWHGRVVAGTLRVWLLSQYVWQIGLEAMKYALGQKRDLRRQRMGVYRQVLRSRLQ